MLQYNRYIFILFFGFLSFLPLGMEAQVDFNKTPNDDLGEVEDKKQELFFEALKQKAIENYDRAVTALLKCIEMDKSQSVFYYELGKNYNKLKNFGAAEEALKDAVKMEPTNEWYANELFDVYMQQKDYKRAIRTVEDIVEYHPKYKEDLAHLYFDNKEYKDALKILDELDEKRGVSSSRDHLRNQIYAATGRKKDQIENLEDRLESNPDEETNYLALIYRYSESGDNEKAFETAKKLLEIKPNSELVHLALYKFYLEDGQTQEAIESMKIVMGSLKVNPEAKTMVLSDFVNFVKEHPEYEADLVEATTLNLDSENGKSYEGVANYFLNKGDKTKALEYFEKAYQVDSGNFGLLKNIMLLQLDLKQFEKVEAKSSDALLKYPSQPLFYLINGVALNQLGKFNRAAEVLETGLDYIIEDTKMESDFYNQLSLSYTQLNNTKKAKTFSDKAKQLESTN
ncbi:MULTISPECIES: lipopolysaccharide assembly protein LapB [Mangrovimonas]|uniref:tetratricopeptide repeat protein n=1 Tax=Mangrovimonas TaxID=1211036 RepID=UPI000A595769|nr:MULTISPECIES: tetratricopeptide repeat protein [Mangrovimonas]MCF1420959.1 tetratricopeptide repeat protein [Mangrovimonas futianensis]